MLDKLVGVRKLIVSIIILGVAIGVTYIKGDVPSGLVSVLGFIFGGFVVGNAVEHVTDGAIEKAELAQPAAPEVPSTVATSEQIAALSLKIEETGKAVAVVQDALIMIINKYGINK